MAAVGFRMEVFREISKGLQTSRVQELPHRQLSIPLQLVLSPALPPTALTVHIASEPGSTSAPPQRGSSIFGLVASALYCWKEERSGDPGRLKPNTELLCLPPELSRLHGREPLRTRSKRNPYRQWTPNKRQVLVAEWVCFYEYGSRLSMREL